MHASMVEEDVLLLVIEVCVTELALAVVVLVIVPVRVVSVPIALEAVPVTDESVYLSLTVLSVVVEPDKRMCHTEPGTSS